MPKSKKPRHAHRPKPGTNYFAVTKENVDRVRSDMADTEIKALFNLENGTCEDMDFYFFRDLINWAIVAVMTRDEEFSNQEEVDEACERLRQAAEALSIVQVRGRKNWCHYVCTADELDKIRVAMEFSGDLMRESLDHRPVRVVKEWEAMRHFSLKARFGKPVSVDVATLKKFIGR